MEKDLPKGFRASSAQAGFKAPDRYDLGLIVSDRPAQVAALFTTNVFCAAPVQVCREAVRERGVARAVVANSGQANACTGDEGLANCRETCRLVAEIAGVAPEEVLPLSTGVIGAQLRMDRWRAAMPELKANLGTRDAEGFTRAFMTTDAFPKYAVREVTLSGGTVRLAGMAKGAGMICPNMATMLSVVLCDAEVEGPVWQAMFGRAVNATFNRVSVDGDTSTNDTCVVLANGLAGNAPITGPGADYDALVEALRYVCEYEAKMIASDGEGAGRLVTCTVQGAASEEQAELMAKAVVRSPLVKCAIFGTDANWGRVLCAVGYSGAEFDPKDVEVKFLSQAGELKVCAGGQGVPFDEDLAKKVLSEPEVVILVTLTAGDATCSCWGCDLTYDYVKINGDYRS